MKKGYIILIVLSVGLLFTLTMLWNKSKALAQAVNVEAKTQEIIDLHREIIGKQAKKQQLCKSLGMYWNAKLVDICPQPLSSE